MEDEIEAIDPEIEKIEEVEDEETDAAEEEVEGDDE